MFVEHFDNVYMCQIELFYQVLPAFLQSSQVSFSLSVHILNGENEEDLAKIKYSALGKNKVRNRVT